MPSDGEIQIIIKAVDDVSATVQRIEKNLGNTQKELTKQATAVAQGFNQQVSSILVLGNAASRVDSIMSSYVNLQLRLENATERVRNAQDRLSDAQKGLTRLQSSGVASADQLADAQQEVERATRGLTIAQNNLARAQNMVIGTYIQMGVSAANLLQSLPQLATAVKGLTAASLAFAATPIGVVLTALGAAAAVVARDIFRAKEATKQLATAQDSLKEALSGQDLAWQNLGNEALRYSRALDEVMGKLSGNLEMQTSEELSNNAELQKVKLELLNLEQQKAELADRNISQEQFKAVLEAGSVDAAIAGITLKITKLQEEEEALRARQDVFAQERTTLQAIAEDQKRKSEETLGLLSEEQEAFNSSYEARLKLVIEFHTSVVAEEQQIANELLALHKKAAREAAAAWRAVGGAKSIAGQANAKNALFPWAPALSDIKNEFMKTPQVSVVMNINSAGPTYDAEALAREIKRVLAVI